MRKTITILISFILAICFTTTAMAGEKGNQRKGKHAYRTVYKSCKERGEVESEKPPISPNEKTQSQWKRIFDKKDFGQFGCAQEWGKLSKEDLLNIYTYLHGHAADSPTPAKCE